MKRTALFFAVVAAAVGATVLASAAGVASAESADGYLHNLAAPPKCALLGETPDPSVPICWVHFGAPQLVLTSQSVILRIGDISDNRADCAADSAGVTTTFSVDGALVPITKQHCRYVPGSLNNLWGGWFPVWWGPEYRYLIPAGSLAPGVHTVMWTATYTTDVSYSLGCTDPSGRCTIPAGTVFTAPKELTITD